MDGPLDHLLRRLPRDSWQYLKGPARQAMDLRTTAEILLRFYEDLAGHGAATPLKTTPAGSSLPFTQRLTDRPGTLDQDLMTAGLSPHYGAVLAVEGETEAIHDRRAGHASPGRRRRASAHHRARRRRPEPGADGRPDRDAKTTLKSEDGRYSSGDADTDKLHGRYRPRGQVLRPGQDRWHTKARSST